MNLPRYHWVRACDRDPNLKDDPDYFLALDADGAEIGLVKWVETGPDHGWFWSMLLVHPGPAFKLPTNGQCATRGQAAQELIACYTAFLAYYRIEIE